MRLGAVGIDRDSVVLLVLAVGYYYLAWCKRAGSEKEALREVSARLVEMLAARGITEDKIVDFWRWRKGAIK